MLGKEDVLLWFKDLESYKRIEVMYELLNMCVPFEIRFLGSCIEEIGKHTYQELRGPSIVANDAERLAKNGALQAGLQDESARHRAVVYMSVLSARNCTCANWYYRTLFRPANPQEHVVNVLSAKEQDFSNVISELLLFYTLGLYHPAFTFEQKTHFREALDVLHRQCGATNGGRNAPPPPPPVESVPAAASVARNVSSHAEANHAVIVPVKSPSAMPADPAMIPPLGMQQNAPPKMQNMLFPSGPPEARPFPAQTNKQSPNVPPRRDASPPQSPLLATTMPAHLDSIAAVPHLDSTLVSPSGLAPPMPPFVTPPEVMPKNVEDENHFISEDKRDQIAKQNGIRFKTMYAALPPPPHEQFANLKIESDKQQSFMLCSNSNSSSSSRNQSPTETPAGTPAVTPHGLGRAAPPPPPPTTTPLLLQQQQQQQPPPQSQPPDAKPRVNGLPSVRLIASQAPCDPPPPYTTAVPSFPGFQHSVPPPPPRSLNCCNCGGLGHASVDCTAQNVEEITQTPYTLDFDSPTVPDNPPEK